MLWLKQQVEWEIKKAHLILQLLQGLNYKKILWNLRIEECERKKR